MARPAVLSIEPTNERPLREPPRPVPRRVAEVIVPTVREYLPWHLLERRLAERASGIAKRAAPVTDDVNTLTDVDALDGKDQVEAVLADGRPSGVRISDRWATSEDEDAPPKSGVSRTMDGDLSYQVYSVDDLARRREAKQREAWLRNRETPPQFPVMSRPWALALARTIDWRKTAKKAGIVVGACSLFGFGMLTAAELTDDVRPSSRAADGPGVEASGTRAASGKSDVVTIPAAVSVRTIVFVPASPSAPVAVPAVEEPPPAKAPQRVTKPVAKPKADVEVFIP